MQIMLENTYSKERADVKYVTCQIVWLKPVISGNVTFLQPYGLHYQYLIVADIHRMISGRAD